MKSTGYFQPMPETQELWDALAAAKATGDRNLVSSLTDQIRRLTVEVKHGRSKHTTGGSTADYIGTAHHVIDIGDEGDW